MLIIIKFIFIERIDFITFISYHSGTRFVFDISIESHKLWLR